MGFRKVVLAISMPEFDPWTHGRQLLARLLQSDSYGYEINKTISTMTGGKFELKEATLYTAFKRLEEQDYIRSYWGDQGSGARRRYYSITPEGPGSLATGCSWNGWRHGKSWIICWKGRIPYKRKAERIRPPALCRNRGQRGYGAGDFAEHFGPV